MPFADIAPTSTWSCLTGHPYSRKGERVYDDNSSSSTASLPKAQVAPMCLQKKLRLEDLESKHNFSPNYKIGIKQKHLKEDSRGCFDAVEW
jgi:hypothetical protein